ncbi:unnamed protein product [Sphagnum balticum]
MAKAAALSEGERATCPNVRSAEFQARGGLPESDWSDRGLILIMPQDLLTGLLAASAWRGARALAQLRRQHSTAWPSQDSIHQGPGREGPLDAETLEHRQQTAGVYLNLLRRQAFP